MEHSVATLQLSSLPAQSGYAMLHTANSLLPTLTPEAHLQITGDSILWPGSNGAKQMMEFQCPGTSSHAA